MHLPVVTLFCSGTIRKRLWIGGSLLLWMTLTMAVANPYLSPPGQSVSRDMLGHDFLVFYAAGTLVREGRSDQLYDLDAIRRIEHEAGAAVGWSIGEAFGPYWNPPFYAWVFAPLSALQVRSALAWWTGINVAACFVAVVLLCRMLPRGSGWRIWGLVPLLLIVSAPFAKSLGHGQNSCTSLVLLVLVVTAWRAGYGLIAGLIAGLLFYKPQLGAVIAGMLVLSLGWRPVVGLVISGGGLLLAMMLGMPGAISLYLHRLPASMHAIQVERTFMWERHVTLKAFWRLLIQGREAGEASGWVMGLTTITVGALGVGLMAVVVRYWTAVRRDRIERGNRSSEGALIQAAENSTGIWRNRLIVATVVAMPLLMPYYLDYDLLLLVVAAVLVGGELAGRAGSGERVLSRAERWLAGGWVMLYLALMVPPGVAGHSRVNLTVPLLSLVAGLSIYRALAQPARSGMVTSPVPLENA